jgi:hypothetical protein
MASILRKPTSKFWFAAFRDATGRQHRKSIGTIDKTKAKRIAAQYETTLSTGVVLGEPGFDLGERGRRDRFGARRGERLFFRRISYAENSQNALPLSSHSSYLRCFKRKRWLRKADVN